MAILVTDEYGVQFEADFTLSGPPRWTFQQDSEHIDSQNQYAEGSPVFRMGILNIIGVDMPATTGMPDTFASKGLVAGAGDTDNAMLQISEIFGASGWQEYLVRLTQGPSQCIGAYKLDFRYSVVDTHGRSDVHTQRIDFQGPSDISLTYLKDLDDSS
jgi:hypothetical protein